MDEEDEGCFTTAGDDEERCLVGKSAARLTDPRMTSGRIIEFAHCPVPESTGIFHLDAFTVVDRP